MAAIPKKILIVGDSASGKTCLLTVFAKDKFPEENVPKYYESYVVDIEVDGIQVELALWDTYGTGSRNVEMSKKIRDWSYTYPDTDIILMCFSIASPDSLDNLSERWLPEVNHFCPYIPVILVGNKKDLRNDPSTLKELTKMKQETVKLEDGRTMTGKIDAFAYLECSAKRKEGVKEVFDTATRIALLATKMKRKPCVLS